MCVPEERVACVRRHCVDRNLVLVAGSLDTPSSSPCFLCVWLVLVFGLWPFFWTIYWDLPFFCQMLGSKKGYLPRV